MQFRLNRSYTKVKDKLNFGDDLYAISCSGRSERSKKLAMKDVTSNLIKDMVKVQHTEVLTQIQVGARFNLKPALAHKILKSVAKGDGLMSKIREKE